MSKAKFKEKQKKLHSQYDEGYYWCGKSGW